MMKTPRSGVILALTVLCALTARGASLETTLKRGERLFSEKKYEQALELFLKAADENPGTPQGADALLMAGVQYDWLAGIKQDSALIEKEKEVLLRLIRQYPQGPRIDDAYLYLGQTYSGAVRVPVKVDCPKAIGLYEKAIAAATDRAWIKAQAKGRIGQCLRLQGREDEARAAFKEVEEKYPGTPWAKEAQKLLASNPKNE